MRTALFDRMATGVHQVGLAQSDAAVQVKWVIRLTWRLRDGDRCRMCKLIARTNDEVVESVFGVKRRIEFDLSGCCYRGHCTAAKSYGPWRYGRRWATGNRTFLTRDGDWLSGNLTLIFGESPID